MQTDCHLSALAAAELPSTGVSRTDTQPWYLVRPTLIVMLATIIGVVGLLITCPELVEVTLTATF